MKKPIVFMFSGQGSHYYHMGRELFENNTTYRTEMLRADALHQSLTGVSIIDKIYDKQFSKFDTLDDISITNAAIAITEYALGKLLISLGIIPEYVLGTSLGEYMAAVFSDVLTFEEVLTAIVLQAGRIQRNCASGRMIAIFHHHSLYESSILKENSELAGINFENHFVISVREKNCKVILDFLLNKQINHHVLMVKYPFHSSYIDNLLPDYLAIINKLIIRLPRKYFISCVNANEIKKIDTNHFWQCVREPIQFHKAITMLEQQGSYTYIDVGPAGTLATFLKYNLPQSSLSATYPILTLYGQDIERLNKLEESFSFETQL